MVVSRGIVKKRSTSVLSLVFACLASYALVLQMLLASALVSPAMAAPTLDDFGNPLCISHTVDAGTSQGNTQPKLPGCCAAACYATAQFLVPNPPGHFVSNRLSTDLSTVVAEADEHFPKRPEVLPSAPRAPPVTA